VINLFLSLLNYIFPVYCCQCKKEGSFLCDQCLKEKIVIQPQQIASNNLEKTGSDQYYDFLIVATNYEKNIIIQKLLKKLKYYFAFEIAAILAKILQKKLLQEKINIKDYDIVPVSLHWKRFLQRGFNQSYLLAKNLGPTTNLLKRIKNTPQQAKLNKHDRENNVREAFIFKGKTVPAKVLLIDDVASTGATLNECAKVLKQAGVQEVLGLVVSSNVKLDNL